MVCLLPFKTMKTKLIKPREARALLKKRVTALKKKLPDNWRILFMHDNKEYAGQSAFLGNVMAERSLHEETIEKIEKWVETLNEKPKK